MSRRCQKIVAAVIGLGFAPFAHAAVIHVNAAAPPAGDGQSWDSAFVDLQSALTTAKSGDQIWIAAGTYAPGVPGDAVSSFGMIDGVAILGGFAGNESSADQRNWEANVTILSGDVGHDDVYQGGGGVLGWDFHSSNSGHVLVGSGTGPTAVLDGVTVMAGATGPVGTPAGDPLMYGSGLYIISGSPTIRNCTFTRNLAAFAAGGGIYSQNASPTITNCSFIQNVVHLGNGAGIAAYGNALPMISDCYFGQNLVIADSGNTGQGAGICFNFLTATLTATIERCTFEYNVARTFYAIGGIEIARGGGISNFGATLTVRDCEFRNNTANAGAGLQTWDPTTVINCLFHHNTAYSHDLSGGASDGGYGAGICLYSFQPDVASVINSTIAHNTGQEGVGLQSLANSSFTLQNSIVWGNIANGQDVDPLNAQIRGNRSIRHCCVQDLLTPIPGEDPPDPANYPGCIVIDPLFESVGSGDFKLVAGSPCIDSGRNSYVPVGVTNDLAGRARFLDDPDVSDTGVGTAPIVDMGAYERALAPVIGDINCDGVLDFADAAALAEVLVSLDMAPCHVAAADLNNDLAANGADVAPFVAVLIE